MKITHLKLSWSVSRGAETYGYNICRLDSDLRRYRCMGGGYDMVGTVLGNWLQEEYQERLQAFAKGQKQEDAGYAVRGYKRLPEFSGLTITPNGSVNLDGACGTESMLRIAEAIGLDVEREYKRQGRNRGETLGWYVSEKEQA